MTVLDDLASELGLAAADLRSKLLAADETLVPNYLSQGTDGAVSADFSGHVHAQGLDLDAPTTISAPTISTDRIRWINAGNGAVVADIGGLDLTGGPKQIVSTIYRSDDGRRVLNELLIQHGIPGTATEEVLLTLQSDGTASRAGTFVNVNVNTSAIPGGGDFTKLLLGGDGTSDFLQSGPYLENLNSFNTTSTAFLDLGAGSCTITSAGIYIIIFGAQIIGLGKVSPNGAGFSASDNASATNATAGNNGMCYAAFKATLTAGALTPFFASVNGSSASFTRVRIIAMGPLAS